MTADSRDAPYGAAATALTLAGVLERLVAIAPSATAADALRVARAVARVHGPAIRRRADVGAVAAQLVRAVRVFARGSEPAVIARELYDAANAAADATPAQCSPALRRSARPAQRMAAAFELACLCEAILADGRSAATDPVRAATAKARIAAAREQSAERVAALLGQAGSQLLARAARDMARHLSDKGASLKPLARIDVAASRPSTALAWRLYGDPSRAGELVRRAGGGTPMFMPKSFVAVSPGA